MANRQIERCQGSCQMIHHPWIQNEIESDFQARYWSRYIQPTLPYLYSLLGLPIPCRFHHHSHCRAQDQSNEIAFVPLHCDHDGRSYMPHSAPRQFLKSLGTIAKLDWRSIRQTDFLNEMALPESHSSIFPSDYRWQWFSIHRQRELN